MNFVFNQLGHKHEIGSLVAIRGSATNTRADKFEKHVRGVVVERCAQQCHGGIHLFYLIRWFNQYGLANSELEKFTEAEIEASVPFEATASVSQLRHELGELAKSLPEQE